MNITLRATYSEVSWPDESEDYEEESGYTDPSNPWGGLDSEVPEGLCGEAFSAWVDENVTAYTCESLSEAVHFVVDFPGGVWDYREAEAEQDYRTGVYRSVTLHVPEEHQDRVFKWASVVQRIADARLAKQREACAR